MAPRGQTAAQKVLPKNNVKIRGSIKNVMTVKGMAYPE